MPQHEHSVYDTDPHYKIDAHTRVITDQSDKPTKLMQYDHNSERFTFEIDRFIDGHDMTLCNKVEVHYINVDASTKESNDGVYKVEDIAISPASDDTVIFSWLVSKKATKYAGTLNFRIRFACVAENAKVVYAWHTEIFKGVSVSNGIDNAEDVVEDYSDILEVWKQEIFASIDDAMSNLVGYDEKLEEISSDIANLEALHNDFIHTVYPTDEQRAKRDMRGWYRIAETTKSGYWSNIFHVQAQVLRSASTSDAIFTAERMSYQSDPSIGILSFASQRGEYDAIDKLRVVYLKNDSTQKSYLEVHINRNATPADAWDGTGTSTGYKFISETHFKGQYNWSLIEPILVSSEVEDGWTVYEKSPFTSAWSQVTASVDDINEFFKDGVPNIDNSIIKTDELKALVDLIHPTMRVDLGEVAGATYEDLSEKKAVQIALNNALSYECSYMTYEVWPVNGLPSDLGSAITYNITFVPDSRGFDSGGGWDMIVRGNVTNITADLGKYSGSYKITDIQASRAMMCFCVMDGVLCIDFDTFVSITIRNPNGKECTYEPEMWTALNLYDSPAGFLALVLDNEETSIFKASTYDMRTQSIDRQLLARIEEAKARREAAKTSNEET